MYIIYIYPYGKTRGVTVQICQLYYLTKIKEKCCKMHCAYDCFAQKVLDEVIASNYVTKLILIAENERIEFHTLISSSI